MGNFWILLFRSLFLTVYFKVLPFITLFQKKCFFINKVCKILQKNPEGFTLNIETFKPVKKGIAVAYQETQDSFGKDGLENTINHALNNNKVLGGWFNVDNKKYYFDSVRIFKNLKKSIKFGIKNNQIAIFNITTLEEITIGG